MQLTDVGANQYVVADSVHLERLSPLLSTGTAGAAAYGGETIAAVSEAIIDAAIQSLSGKLSPGMHQPMPAFTADLALVAILDELEETPL